MGVPHDPLSQSTRDSLPLGQRPPHAESSDARHIDQPTRPKSSFVTIMTQPSMHIMALFAFIYVGIEVSIGGQHP